MEARKNVSNVSTPPVQMVQEAKASESREALYAALTAAVTMLTEVGKVHLDLTVESHKHDVEMVNRRAVMSDRIREELCKLLVEAETDEELELLRKKFHLLLELSASVRSHVVRTMYSDDTTTKEVEDSYK